MSHDYAQTARLADLDESQVTSLCIALERSLERYHAEPPHFDVVSPAPVGSCIGNQQLILKALRDVQHGRQNPLVKSIMVRVEVAS